MENEKVAYNEAALKEQEEELIKAFSVIYENRKFKQISSDIHRDEEKVRKKRLEALKAFFK